MNILAARTPLCTRRGAVQFVKPEHFAERCQPRWGSNLRDYPHSIRFLMETHLRWIQKLALESKLLPANLNPIWAGIFSSSCYGFTNCTAPLLVHSGWVLVVCKFCWGITSPIHPSSKTLIATYICLKR